MPCVADDVSQPYAVHERGEEDPELGKTRSMTKGTASGERPELPAKLAQAVIQRRRKSGTRVRVPSASREKPLERYERPHREEDPAVFDGRRLGEPRSPAPSAVTRQLILPAQRSYFLMETLLENLPRERHTEESRPASGCLSSPDARQ